LLAGVLRGGEVHALADEGQVLTGADVGGHYA